MATIRVNGATRQSGAGFHARRGEPGRLRTRAAVLDAELTDQVGSPFRGIVPDVDADDYDEDED